MSNLFYKTDSKNNTGVGTNIIEAQTVGLTLDFSKIGESNGVIKMNENSQVNKEQQTMQIEHQSIPCRRDRQGLSWARRRTRYNRASATIRPSSLHTEAFE